MYKCIRHVYFKIPISFLTLTNMSISNNNKSLDKCILRDLKLFSQVMVTAQTCVYMVATEWTYIRSVCTVWSYVCAVGLVPNSCMKWW